MRHRLRFMSSGLILGALLLTPAAANAGVGSAVARGAEKSAARAVEKAALRVLGKAELRSAERSALRSTERAALSKADGATIRATGNADRVAVLDRARDATTAARALDEPRLAFRYVGDRKLQRELIGGFPAGTHFTASAGPGRPLSPLGARLRLGLPARPSWRISAELPPGQPVRFNKVIGGNKPGLGEVTLARPMSWTQVRRVVPVAAPSSPLGTRLLKEIEAKGLR